jgi:dTDP-4-dehydrorhamnose reductase
MTERPILVLGATGQVGVESLLLLGALGPVVGLTRAELDLADPSAIRNTVRRLHPRWIVNAAAYTAVDKAESDSRAAFAINGDAPGILGEEAHRIGAPVIHFSTDYVFAGDGTRPWSEGDPTAPLNVYGASKLAGERALAASGAAHLIFRTSWVFGAHGKNFLLTILKLASEREEVSIVDDQHGAPTWARSLGELVAQCIARLEKVTLSNRLTLAEAMQTIGGTYHACSTGETTWFGFASELLRIEQLARPERRLAKLVPVPSTTFPTVARRPLNSRLNCEKLGSTLGLGMPSWQDAASRVMGELIPARDETPDVA